MGWSTTSDLDRFAAAAGGYLRSRAAENTLLLSAAQDARRNQAQQLLLGWWTPPDGEEPRGAFVHDPAAPLLISGRTPEMAAALAATLAKLGRQVRGVDAPTDVADAFAAAWSQRAGMSVRAHRNCRVYRLTTAPQGAPLQGTPPQGASAGHAWPPPELPGPPGPPGRLRLATSADHAMLTDWLGVAAIEAAERLTSASDAASDLLSYGGAFFWEAPHKSGRLRDVAHYLAIPHHRDLAQFGEPVPQPVALVTLARPVAGIVRISMIYTLPERRHTGYAAAATQAVSRALLQDSGPDTPLPGMLGHGCVREVVMIADKNRSDHWGGRFGFQLIGERAVLRFGPATGAVPRVNSTNPMPRLPTGPLPRLPRIGRGSGRL